MTAEVDQEHVDQLVHYITNKMHKPAHEYALAGVRYAYPTVDLTTVVRNHPATHMYHELMDRWQNTLIRKASEALTPSRV